MLIRLSLLRLQWMGREWRALGLATRNDGIAPALVFVSTGFTEATLILTRHSPGFLTGFGLQGQDSSSRCQTQAHSCCSRAGNSCCSRAGNAAHGCAASCLKAEKRQLLFHVVAAVGFGCIVTSIIPGVRILQHGRGAGRVDVCGLHAPDDAGRAAWGDCRAAPARYLL